MSFSDLGWILFFFQNLLQFIVLYIYLNRQCRRCKEVKTIDRIFQKLCRSCSRKEKEGREIKKF